MTKNNHLTEDISETLLAQLKQTRDLFQQTLLPPHPPLSTEAAQAYNAALFHLQAAREEIKKALS